ncbi:hypothetical protein AUI06_10615 [archaeon 13_2_20CM_2_52_21]|nr:MAG: hypothetical protein AUI06_10615 [archaeon 13_2_20CM_2_52_21]
MLSELNPCPTWPPMKKVRGRVALVPLEDECFLVLVQGSKIPEEARDIIQRLSSPVQEESTVFAWK